MYGTYTLEVLVTGDCEELGTCALQASGGGVSTSDGAAAAELPGAGAAGLVAAARGRVAVVPPELAALGAAPASGVRTVEVRSAADGSLVASLTPADPVRAVALTRTALALLLEAGGGAKRIARYALADGGLLDATAVARGTAPALSAAEGAIVYRVGRRIRALDTGDGTTSLVAVAAAEPIGLSIEGRRIAWAENTGTGGRIRAVALR